MEWAKQRYRFRKVLTYIDSPLLVFLLVFICLPCLVLSAEEDNSNNLNNTGNPHREILHRKTNQISVNITSEDGTNGKNNGDKIENKSNSGSGEDSIKNHEQLNNENKKRNHQNQIRPHLSHRNNPEEDDEECNKTTSSLRNKDLHGTGGEFHKIESILRDIFFDELDSDEELEETDNNVNNEGEDSLSRSSNSQINKSQILISRHARSEHEIDGRAQGSSKGKAKGSKSSSNGNNNNNGDSNGRNKGGKNGKQKAKGGKGSSKTTDLTKYNEYMDSVFRRMNAMIKSKKMDPLRVNLYAGPSKKPSGGGNGNKKKNTARMNLDSEEGFDEDDFEDEEDSENGPARKDIFLNISKQHGAEHKYDSESTRKIRALLEAVNGTIPNLEDRDQSETLEDGESPRGTSKESSKKRPKPNRNKETGGNNNNNSNNKNSKSKDKGEGNNNPNKKTGNKGGNKGLSKNKKNKNNRNSTRPTRGILHGLSTLKRDGNVAVIKQGEKARIVRASFLLGPVSLEIMPKKSKAGDSEKPVAATATAPKLRGVLEVRLKKGSPTRIRRLRVYPPKNVKVDGSSGTSAVATKGSNKPRQYGKVTPMATVRLRQIASTVVRQSDRSPKP